MINNFRVVKTSSHAFMETEEITGYGSVGINYDLQITKLKFTKEPENTKKQIFEYTFSINYINPSMGYIRYEGTLDYTEEDDETVEQTSDELAPELRHKMAGTIIMNLIPLALLLSKAMGLPPASPLPIPEFTPSKKLDKLDRIPDGMYG